MATVATEANPTTETLADLVRRIGDVPLERIRMHPPPGTAKERDVLAAHAAPQRWLCELVDGVLVEKAVGSREALVAALLVQRMWNFLDEHDLGLALGADGMLRLRPGLVRIPDVSFISWDRLPGGELPDVAIARVAPDLAVEVISESNTTSEIERKLDEYFDTGVRLAWVIDPATESARVYTTRHKSRRLDKEQSLSGGSVLPGFLVPLKDLFGRRRRRRRESR
jgi:Uma2 family endonuclease